MNDSRFVKLDDNADRFYGLPQFGLGHIDRAETIATFNRLLEEADGDSTEFIEALADLVDRQNKLASIDAAEVISSVVSMYEGIQNVVLYPGDPVRLFLSTLAAIISAQNNVIDWTQKQNFIRYATGAYLDALAALLGVYRLEAFPAKTRLKYSVKEPIARPVAIPQGTRATADGKIFFSTDSLVVIPAGQPYVEVSATCMTYGAEGNGLLPGQINRAVDVVALVSAVVNVVASEGGSDVEDDESLRNRARMAPGQFSTAGARLSYVYWALTAHGNIADVSISGPEDRGGERLGEVDVIVMLKGGAIPEVDGVELEAVENVLNGEKIRPLTDKVNVLPVDTVDIEYTVTWFITTEQAIQFTAIKERVNAAVTDYEAWQIERIGRDVNPDRLVQLCLAAGAKRTEIVGLSFTELGRTTVARFNGREIIFGGVESD